MDGYEKTQRHSFIGRRLVLMRMIIRIRTISAITISKNCKMLKLLGFAVGCCFLLFDVGLLKMMITIWKSWLSLPRACLCCGVFLSYLSKNNNSGIFCVFKKTVNRNIFITFERLYVSYVENNADDDLFIDKQYNTTPFSHKYSRYGEFTET